MPTVVASRQTESESRASLPGLSPERVRDLAVAQEDGAVFSHRMAVMC